MDGDDIAMLDSEIVADDPVDSCATIIEVVVGKDDQDSVPSLLALHKDSVATEKLERLHRVVGQCDDGVVIIRGIGDTR